MRLGEVIGRWLGKVEVVLAGADADLREGEDALLAGDPMRARAAARRVLARAPESPLGMALLADACEAAGLDAELALTLEDLARRAGSSAEVWLRLGRARRATGAPAEEARDAFVRGLAVAESGSEARRDVLLELADLDLAAGDGARAELWLDRVATDRSAPVAVRRAEARLAAGDARGAARALEAIDPQALDGRSALARGRALAMQADAEAFAPLVRAMILDAPGASEALSSALAWIPVDGPTRARVRAVVDAKGEGALARWRAAFARAAGERDEARAALQEAVASGDRGAAGALLEAALDDQDAGALAVALHAFEGASPSATLEDARRLPTAPLETARGAATLDEVGLVTAPRVVAWADALARGVARAWIPPTGAPADWTRVLGRLDEHARKLGDLDAVARIAALSAERARPVRVAIVGEFNAGKSTFINALIGADVAPTGVLPTTATLHHLRYAPDPIARILLHDAPSPGSPPERIVALGDLRPTLKTVDTTSVRRVEILLPIASLTRVEILDTPGFNAPDERHTDAARAAFEEADFAIWLLDAGQAMKQTERKILEEARAAGLPVQMLVNKADRLAPADLARVMALVDASLAAANLASWTPPLALSARKALAGRLGDAEALASSGWAAVTTLLDEQIVGRSDELKERALRRRALAVVSDLVARAARLADEERELAARKVARAHAVARAASKLDADADRIAGRIAASLGPAAEAWRRDMEVVVTGRDDRAAAADPVLARYRIERGLERLAAPLAQALSGLALEAELAPRELMPLARALVRASAVASGHEGEEDACGPLARAAVATLVEHLFALAVPAEPPARAAGLLRELGAFADALARAS